MKIKIESVDVYEAQSPEFLTALLKSIPYCCFLRQQQEKRTYEKLLDWIISDGPNLDSEKPPPLKEIYKMAGISYSHIGSHLRSIYYDILKLNGTHPRKFMEKDQRMYILQIENSGPFALGLYETPRVGDQFQFPFLKPKLGTEHFWVKKVLQEIFNGGHIISIDLTADPPNLYLQLLFEKAYLNEELSITDSLGSSHYDTTKKLLKLYKNL